MSKNEWKELREYIDAYRSGKITRAEFVKLWGAAWVLRCFAAYNEKVVEE